MLPSPRCRAALCWALATAACSHAAPVSPAPAPVSSRPALPPPAAPDLEFMTGMIGHHAQAITMSKWAPTHGASPSLQIMAARIINAQEDEIATMERWLRDHNIPIPDRNAHGMKMKMNGMEHTMLMPGMLTDEQMAQLDAARGVEFDRLFLTYMIQHHTGALTMVDKLFGSYGGAQDEIVFKFANDVNADQGSEIDRMHKMLDTLPPAQTAP